MAGPRARKVRDWYIIALVSGEVVGYLRREANGFTTPCVGGEGRRGRRGGWRRSGGPCGGQGGGGEGGGEEGGGRGRERWRGRGQVAREGVCHKEGGARETSATVGDGDGVVAAVTVAVWRRGRRRGRMIPVREEEVKGETRC